MTFRRRLGGALILAVVAAFLVPLGGSPAIAASVSNPTPVYRFYKTDGSHFFTNSESEKANVQRTASSSYRYEGVAFYSYPTQVAGTSPVYRFYNFRQGVHFYTINPNEHQTVLTTASLTYRYEGVAYYANTTQVTDSAPVFRFYKFRQGVHFYTSNAGEAAALRVNASLTYRDEGIAYYLPTTLTFSGTASGEFRTDSFVLPTGRIETTATYKGGLVAGLCPANPLEKCGTIADEGTGDGQTASSNLVDEGSYYLGGYAYGPWTVEILLP